MGQGLGRQWARVDAQVEAPDEPGQSGPAWRCCSDGLHVATLIAQLHLTQDRQPGTQLGGANGMDEEKEGKQGSREPAAGQASAIGRATWHVRCVACDAWAGRLCAGMLPHVHVCEPVNSIAPGVCVPLLLPNPQLHPRHNPCMHTCVRLCASMVLACMTSTCSCCSSSRGAALGQSVTTSCTRLGGSTCTQRQSKD